MPIYQYYSHFVRITRNGRNIIKFLKITLFLMAGVSYATSVHEYAQAYAQQPLRHELLYNAGVEAARTKDYQQAYDYFTAFTEGLNLEEQPLFSKTQLEQAWYNRGNAAFQIKNYQASLESFERALEQNPDNELARKKIEYIKKLLEQQKQEEQQSSQNKDNSKDEKKDKQNKKNQQDQQQDQQENKNQDKNDEGDSEKEDGKEQKNNEQRRDQQNSDQQRSKDKNGKDESQKKDEMSDQQKQEKNQQKDNGKQEQKNDQQKAANEQKENVELTEQERRILAAVQELDQKMNETMELQKLKKAQGSPYAHNNW